MKRGNPPNTGAVDDYLKAIRVTRNMLRDRMGVRPASATRTLQKLASQRLSFANYEKHHGVRLTAAEKHRALEVLLHHRLLERYLHQVLGYPWDEANEEAARLEHFISKRLEDRIAAKLGDPKMDPYGRPIPVRRGVVQIRAEILLLEWACGIPAVVSSVSDRVVAALPEMRQLGVARAVVLVVEPGTRTTALPVRKAGRQGAIRLSHSFARVILVAGVPAPATDRS